MTLTHAEQNSSLALTHVDMNRRSLLIGGGLVTLMGIAGCGTLPSGSGTGASASATGILAGIRSSHGLGSLSPDSRLERAALQQAAYMAQSRRMKHTTGWGKDFGSRVKDNGIEGAAAENIAEGRMDVARVMEMWMNSPPHRRNMLDPRFARFGLAYSADSKNSQWRYWTLVLGK